MIKILIVEDSPTVRRLVKGSLISIGYNDIFESEDGVAALKMLKIQPFDLVITDWNMPNMNGIELINVIRNDDKMSELPIVLITTKSEREDIKKAAQSKVNGYLVKPFNTEALNRVISPLADKIIAKRNNKHKNILKIQILLNVDSTQPIDEIQISKAYKSGNEQMELSSTFIEFIPSDMTIASYIHLIGNKINFTSENINNENNTKENLHL